VPFRAPARISKKFKKDERAEGRKMRSANAIRLLLAAMAMLALTPMLPVPATAQVAVGISVGFAPPELPVYEQPICPAEGYIWTPGYWAWDPDYEDYYWVPGTWVLAPEVGFLWTPGYWAWGGTAFVFYEGYWGPVVGFYGGINYGYGYFGRGYEGGRWDGGRFYYNRTVNHINVTEIHNVYDTRVVNNNVNVTRVSYHGGNGGLRADPTPQEQAAARQHHVGPAPAQIQHIQAARSNRELHASENRGKPPIAATQKPAAFTGGAVVPAKKGGKYNPPPNRGANNRAANNPNRPPNGSRSENSANRAENNANRPNYVHPNELPKANRPDRPPAAGNPKADQKYQRDQEKMYQKQEQERQKLQQQQDREHQRAAQQRADDSRRQQMEQRHQQQTQQMQQRHEQQQQQMEQRQPPRQQPPPPPNDRRPPNGKP
jgi:WXXGXW repeat (2 copies)